MAGETIRSEATCLAIRPWSRTSHVVFWLTPRGRLGTVVKGAVRPKSFFLGQYDLNYTCDILYYARARGDLHALRECAPVSRRDALRGDYRKLALAGHFRRLAADYAPAGPDAAAWHELLEKSLDALCGETCVPLVRRLLRYELDVLHLQGLSPEIEAEEGLFHLRGERSIPVSPEVAACLRDPLHAGEGEETPHNAARVLGAFYQFHLDAAIDARRTVLAMLAKGGCQKPFESV
jgi:hypothetical protein